MKTKIINCKIQTCFECPYLVFEYTWVNCNLTKKTIPEDIYEHGPIPNFCELEDFIDASK